MVQGWGPGELASESASFSSDPEFPFLERGAGSEALDQGGGSVAPRMGFFLHAPVRCYDPLPNPRIHAVIRAHFAPLSTRSTRVSPAPPRIPRPAITALPHRHPVRVPPPISSDLLPRLIRASPLTDTHFLLSKPRFLRIYPCEVALTLRAKAFGLRPQQQNPKHPETRCPSKNTNVF